MPLYDVGQLRSVTKRPGVAVTEFERRSRVGRPWRHARRWARHTPNTEIAVIMVSVGIALIFIAAIVAATVL